MLAREQIDTEELLEGGYRKERSASARASATARGAAGAEGELVALIEDLSEQMMTAAGELQFEVAARLRDEIKDLKKELRQMRAAN